MDKSQGYSTLESDRRKSNDIQECRRSGKGYNDISIPSEYVHKNEICKLLKQEKQSIHER